MIISIFFNLSQIKFYLFSKYLDLKFNDDNYIDSYIVKRLFVTLIATMK